MVTERRSIMPLPCPLFDIWHRHALWFALATIAISGSLISFYLRSTPPNTRCYAINTLPVPAPNIRTRFVPRSCHPRRWIEASTRLGLRALQYREESANRMLMTEASFAQCMTLLRWIDKEGEPLAQLQFSSKPPRRRIACDFTFHCP